MITSKEILDQINELSLGQLATPLPTDPIEVAPHDYASSSQVGGSSTIQDPSGNPLSTSSPLNLGKPFDNADYPRFTQPDMPEGSKLDQTLERMKSWGKGIPNMYQLSRS